MLFFHNKEKVDTAHLMKPLQEDVLRGIFNLSMLRAFEQLVYCLYINFQIQKYDLFKILPIRLNSIMNFQFVSAIL